MADSTKRRKYDNPMAEEVSAVGERVKGAAKDGVGAVTGNRDLEERGEQENAEGRARQAANHVFGSFRDRESAERAYHSLSERGYGRDDVNVLMSSDTHRKYFDEDDDTEFQSKAMEGAGAGAAIGGAAVGILGAVVAVGTTIAVPGLGLVLAGPLVAGLAGAGAGSIAGGLIGALIGWGIPEERAKQYESDIKEGGIVMSVAPRDDDDAGFVESEWKRHEGRNISR